MTVNTQTLTTLMLVIDKAEAGARDIRLVRDLGGNVPFGTCEDHRTEVLGDLLDAIDQIEPGLGRRLQNAMHPLTVDEVEPSSTVQLLLGDEVPA